MFVIDTNPSVIDAAAGIINPADNPGGMTFGDMNRIEQGNTQRWYWVNKSNDYINIEQVYNNLVNANYNRNAPVVTLSNIQHALADPGGTLYQQFQKRIGWMTGNLISGGIGFYLDGDSTTSVKMIILKKDDQDNYTIGRNVSYATTVGVGSGSNASNLATFVDLVYYNGGLAPGISKSLAGPYNIEYASLGPDETPLYDVVAQQSATEVKIDSGSSFTIPLRQTPNLYGDGGGGTVLSSYFMDFLEGFAFTPDPDKEGTVDDEGGGGGGGRDYQEQPWPELPDDPEVASGIIKIFHPDNAILNQFINFIYSAPSQIIDNFKKIWVNPMDSIISLALVPFPVVDSTSEDIKFCGVSSEVTCPTLASRFKMLDLGEVTIPHRYNSFLDYAPYTQARIWLPFIGFQEMDINDIEGATLQCKYYCDVVTGETIALVRCIKHMNKYDVNYNCITYTFNGNILRQIPLSGNNYQQLYSGIIGLVGTAIAAPAALPQAIGSQIATQQVRVQRSGNISGNSGWMGSFTPYILLEEPTRAVPSTKASEYSGLIGLPGWVTKKLANVHGYTEFDPDSIRFEKLSNKITGTEIEMLKEYFRSGVIM